VSRPIDIDCVEAVLLADGWHQVFRQTFDLGVYEFVQATGSEVSVLYEGGTGFGFSEQDGNGDLRRFTGPVSSVLAVRYTRASDATHPDG
jgi:hypothetical protein